MSTDLSLRLIASLDSLILSMSVIDDTDDDGPRLEAVTTR